MSLTFLTSVITKAKPYTPNPGPQAVAVAPQNGKPNPMANKHMQSKRRPRKRPFNGKKTVNPTEPDFRFIPDFRFKV